MYPLASFYGVKTYKKWRTRSTEGAPIRDLSSSKTADGDGAIADMYDVSSYHDLGECVAFLQTMNKRLALFFRGQRTSHVPLPVLLRDGWNPFDEDRRFAITERNRPAYWGALPEIGSRVYKVCDNSAFGLPRHRGLKSIREVQWAIIQHYALWPTPCIDLSSSFRVAASFALDAEYGTSDNERIGYLYVVGMPHSTGSITFDIDQHICLARLQSACPPVAKRPFYQDGFLVSHFPIEALSGDNPLTPGDASLKPRIIAALRLRDAGQFWKDRASFPVVSKSALYGESDELKESFLKELRSDILGKAESLST